MTTHWLVAAALALGTVAASGCGNSCSSLADRACAKAGESNRVCQRLRAIAASPSDKELQACNAGQAFADELEKR